MQRWSSGLLLPHCQRWLLIGLLLIGWPMLAQRPIRFTAELGGYAATIGRTPFWLRANQYGIVPFSAPSQTMRFSVKSGYKLYQDRHRVNVAYGLSVVGNLEPAAVPARTGSVLLPEAWVSLRLGRWELYAGRRRETTGLADSTIGSGSYSWSGNALPIPKIQIGIPVFTPVGFTNSRVSIMGGFAHGWLDPTGYVSHSFLHQSFAYVRVGRPSEVVRLIGGFNHQVVWGGYSKDLPATGLVKSPYLPASLRDYLAVVIGDNGGLSDTARYADFDLTNRVGNHLGTIDFGAEIDLVRHTLLIYRQNIYETGALYYLTNISDGLNGIRLRRNDPTGLWQDLVLEVLNTTSQGGPVFVLEDPYKRGKNDYFNHQQFRDGWSYQNNTIGTPFIPPAWGPNGERPYGGFTRNNRVWVWHLGLSGVLPSRWSRRKESIFEENQAVTARVSTGPPRPKPLPILPRYSLKLSYSRNYGTYNFPVPRMKPQFSGIASVSIPLRWLDGLLLESSVAVDVGELYPTSVGGYLGIRKVLTNTVR